MQLCGSLSILWAWDENWPFPVLWPQLNKYKSIVVLDWSSPDLWSRTSIFPLLKRGDYITFSYSHSLDHSHNQDNTVFGIKTDIEINEIDIPEIGSHLHGQSICNKITKELWGRDNFFNIWFWNYWTCKIMKLNPYLMWHARNNLKWMIHLNVKIKALNFLKESIEENTSSLGLGSFLNR